MTNTLNKMNSVGKAYIQFTYILPMLCIACCLLPIGTYLMTKKPKYTKNEKGMITKSECDRLKSKKNKIRYECDVEYSYKVNGKEYLNQQQITSQRKYDNGDKIEIQYRPEDPSDSRMKQLSKREIGGGLITSSVSLFICSYLVYTFTKNVKGAGTAMMAGNIVSRFTN